MAPAALLLRILALCFIPSSPFCFLARAAPAPSAALPGDAVIARNNRQRREAVDGELADFALRRLRQEGRDAKTGTAYDVTLPSWTAPLQGAVKGCDVMKGKAGSIARRGLQFNDFNLPQGIRPALLSDSTAAGSPPQAADDFLMNQLLLVYRRIDSRGLDFTFYSLPHGYTFMSPVVGIITYTYHADELLLNTSSLAEVQLMTSSTASITIAVPDVVTASHSSAIAAAAAAATTIHGSTELLLLCVSFLPDGSFSFSNLTQPPNICSSPTLVDVAIVAAAAGSDASPILHSAPPGDESGASRRNHGSGSAANTILSPTPKPSPPALQQNHPHRSIIVVILALGGGLLLFAAAIVAICLLAHALLKGDLLALCKGQDNDDAKDEVKEMFETTRSVGHIRAPTVPSLRTKPSLEVGSLRFPCETL